MPQQITLHVHERGPDHGDPDRPALVFLHHFGGSGRLWDPVMDTLAREHRCIAPDLRGFGSSPAPGEEPAAFSVGVMADDVHTLLDGLHISRFVLAGHSMGGKVALALAASAPPGLAAVALLAPSPPTPEPMEKPERERLLAGHGDPAAAEETLRQITARPLPETWRRAVVEDNLRASRSAWRAWLEHGSREDISAWMRAIPVPVSIALGAEDAAITGCLVEREIAARLSLPTPMRVLLGAGHLLPLEAPAAVSNLLSDVVARL